jgi:hypothetical protein
MGIIMRYYDTTTKNETHTISDSTIPMTDSRVVDFFKPLEEGYMVDYTADNLPLIVKRPSKTVEEQELYDSKQYARDRAEAYPSLTEQADMAYWDRQNNTTTLDDAITAVKLQFPKG